jgi:hypothetical protein
MEYLCSNKYQELCPFFLSSDLEVSEEGKEPPTWSLLLFLLASPRGDLLLFLDFAFIFLHFPAKKPCQVPKPPKPNKQKEIHLAL